jgi:hypothetical protein
MQLIRGSVFRAISVLFIFVIVFAGSAFLSGVRVVGLYSPDLQVIPFGYQYQGHPLTGFVYELYPGYRLAKLTVLFRGKRQGPEIHWYENGQRWIERHYRNGLEVGIHRAWYPDGEVKFLKTFSDQGLPHGEFYAWHNNGKLAEYVRFDQGKEVATKSWTGGGKPFYNYILRDGHRVGLQGDTFCEPRKVAN